MTATIVAMDGSGSTTPVRILLPYEASWQSRNLVHDLIGGGIAIALVSARPRAGELALLYVEQGDAFAAARLHGGANTFTLTETESPHLGMTYALADGGEARVAQSADDGLWTVTIGYQEVTP